MGRARALRAPRAPMPRSMPVDPPLDVPETPALGGLRIVVVDDAEPNVALLQALLESWGYTNVVGISDPGRALAHCREHPPDLLLLDLHMPDPDGYAILEALGPQIRAAVSLPVLVLTGSSGSLAKHDVLAAGARDFLGKPFDHDEVRLRVRNALEIRRLQLVQRAHEADLERRVAARTADVEAARLEVLDRLARAGEFRDDATGEHTRRVGETAALLAERAGAGPDYVRGIRLAAPLHDIGKLAVPDRILLKPGPLTDAEYAAMKRHAEIGAEIAGGSTSRLMALAGEIALSHHERWDGQGYPRGLAGEAIPLSGRIVAVADVFDALTHERPYKRAWPVPQAVAEIAAQAGRQFDPVLIEAFLGLDHDALI
jgi:putative two-component system response regulator